MCLYEAWQSSCCNLPHPLLCHMFAAVDGAAFFDLFLLSPSALSVPSVLTGHVTGHCAAVPPLSIAPHGRTGAEVSSMRAEMPPCSASGAYG